MVFQDGLSLVISHGIHIDVIDCDATNVIKELNSCYFDSTFGVIIVDIVDLLSLVGDSICHHISSKGNMVAHALATLGMSCFDSFVVDEIIFLLLFMIY